MLMKGHPTGCILGNSTPLEATCRLPDCRPVPNYYSCLQTFVSWDGLQNQLHVRWANRGCSSTQEWTWIYSWWKEPIQARGPLPASRPCLPREQAFMKTFPQNHNNSITIPSSRYLRHDCICYSANFEPSAPLAAPPPPPPPVYCILADEPKWERVSLSPFPRGCVERRLAAARFTPVLLVRVSPSHQPWRGGVGDSQLTCSFGTTICGCGGKMIY